jgi:hypothetical protein
MGNLSILIALVPANPDRRFKANPLPVLYHALDFGKVNTDQIPGLKDV